MRRRVEILIDPRFLLPIVLSIIVLYPPQTGYAESFRYMDESGNIFFVDRVEDVPLQYRSQILLPTPTPAATSAAPPPTAKPVKPVSRNKAPSGPRPFQKKAPPGNPPRAKKNGPDRSPAAGKSPTPTPNPEEVLSAF